ncbi:CMGC family protein kinase [Tritrichomonas foetus]|uniref:cyclin-dependent kinase n=1 Tax=Tritrichomonas foetus TaxID=1144522 RepID=A0A1J4JGD0_9EUKA|nr:CMGC family protein kinase [Tritrichomonas foetus]|eukprot:OHS96260.1 CMGC family protein kinase [Tritrichomonas foetus]
MQSLDDLYEIIAVLGAGNYGQVFKARDRSTGEVVALKRIKSIQQSEGFPRVALREIVSLRSLGTENPNIIALKNVIKIDHPKSVYLVFDYFEFDLYGLITSPMIKPFTPAQVKCYLKQMLIGLDTIHQAGIIHRDLKPANILLSTDNQLKIGDFGLSRICPNDNSGPMTHKVVTLWYRAPELLLGQTKYGPEIDIWSLGCTLFEMITGKPLFKGETDLEQLGCIIRMLGLPSEEHFPGWRNLPNAQLFSRNQHNGNRNGSNSTSNFERFLDEKLPAEFLDAKPLLTRMIDINPQKRISVQDALLHPYFHEDESKGEKFSPESLPPIFHGEIHMKYRPVPQKKKRVNLFDLRPIIRLPPPIIAD